MNSKEYGLFYAKQQADTEKGICLLIGIKTHWFPKRHLQRVGKDQYAAPLWLLTEKAIKPVADMEPLETAENSDDQEVGEFNIKPFAHQVEAAQKMGSLQHGALFMEMGTGKTKVALDLAKSRYMDGKIGGLLYLCPVSVKDHIYSQMQMNDTAIPVMIMGIESLSSSLRAFNACTDFIANYESVQLVIDEAHLLKNPDANRSKRVQELAKMADYTLAMTGTPITQSPADLWGIFKALNPNKPLMGYSSYGKFEAKHLVLGGYNRKQIVGYRNIEPLMAHIAPMVYQITKSECLDLPPKLYQSRTIALPKAVMHQYNEKKREMLDAYERTQNPNIIMAMFTELQKLTTIENEAKLEQVRDIYEQTGRLVVWCKYRREVRDLLSWWPGEHSYILDGDTPQKIRAKEVEKWSADPNGLLIANIAVGGLGIELTAGHTAVYYSNTFRYSDRIQSEDRFHRIGQVNPVTYIDLWTDTGMDRIIAACLKRKQNLADYIKDLISKNQPIEV